MLVDTSGGRHSGTHATGLSAYGAIATTLPYRGAWSPSSPVTHGDIAAGCVPLTALICSNAREEKACKSSGLPIIMASPDSGATAHVTNNHLSLIDKRNCTEVFGQANGHVTKCTCIGNMPVIASTKGVNGAPGATVQFIITNVRCVPPFCYTLLSVDQLWKEQRVDARFRDHAPPPISP